MKLVYNREFTPEVIKGLGWKEIMVFGSNKSGFHVGGLAKVAKKSLGAVYGQAQGLQGQSYAIVTYPADMEVLKKQISDFIIFAKKERPDLKYFVTKIGCGNAGFTAYDIAPLFFDALTLNNVILPREFVAVLKNDSRLTGGSSRSWNSKCDFLDVYADAIRRFKEGDGRGYDIVKDLRVRVFHNTVGIANNGYYYTEENDFVCLVDPSWLKRESVFYSEEFRVNNVPRLEGETVIRIVERDCMNYARELSDAGYYPAVLNMASNVKPGGGVLSGSAAQEESIFRRTDLFKSLYQYADFGGEFGVKCSAERYPLNDDFGGIYSSGIWLFRESEKSGYKLMKKPVRLSYISVAALKRPTLVKDVHGKLKIDGSLVGRAKNKIRTVLRIGLKHRHDALVLGAWGCGAYGCPPEHMAELFHEVLKEEEFRNKFRLIVFAIIEDHNSLKAHNPEGNLKPFKREFERQ